MINCNDCKTLKRIFCIVACKDMNSYFSAAEGNRTGDGSRTIQLIILCAVLFITSVVASCELSPPVPTAAKWNIDPELRYRANQQVKEVP